MKKAFLRPFILILVFFAGLYVLREPLRNMDSNFALLKYHYVNPVIAYIKGVATTTQEQGVIALNDDGEPYDIYTGATTTPSGGSTSGTTKSPTLRDRLVTANNSLEANASRLSINGIFENTNKERVARQFPALKLNATLNRSAEIKLQDMFTNQYFQHVSPKGLGVTDLVRETGYEYIVVGENLALGNFGGDVQVVTAWMNSPGHRANMLDPRFQEIGIAVGKGLYNGKEQWIAVQHFGKPLSSCEGPNYALKDKIAIHTNELAAMETELTALKKQIESSTDRGPEQDERIARYNSLVSDYNTRLEGLKDEIATYNEQVRKFNGCAGLTK